MLCDPLLHLDIKPKTVNAECDQGKQKPFDIVPEKLCAGSFKDKLSAVDDGMASDPALTIADRPRCGNSQGNQNNQPGSKVGADQPEKASGEFGFHVIPPINISR